MRAARSIWRGNESPRSSSTCGSTPCACAVRSACASRALEPLYIDAVHIFTAEARPTVSPTVRASIHGGAAAASSAADRAGEIDARAVAGTRRAAGDRAVDELETRLGEHLLELAHGRRRDRVPVRDERTWRRSGPRPPRSPPRSRAASPGGTIESTSSDSPTTASRSGRSSSPACSASPPCGRCGRRPSRRRGSLRRGRRHRPRSPSRPG